GGCDKLLPRGWAARIAAQIPAARSAVIPDAGHCPQIEQPVAVNELLLEFLGRHETGNEEVSAS
ncbi:MAG TPA: alpha/beta hydrolase, partial [Mycobacterium sp.]|nr:alpha/beta hydrolase [Mycobacterium sp.]